jgi:hypothetical protein
MDDLMRSRDQALAAVREFPAEHGRLPRWREWEMATASRPCAKTIERRWGWREPCCGLLATRWVVADRSGVGRERAAAVSADVHAALRELEAGLSGG